MIKSIPTYKKLPLELDKWYITRFQNKEKFLIKFIEKNAYRVWGIFENSQHLGICPLNADRILNEEIFDKKVEICQNCNTPIND